MPRIDCAGLRTPALRAERRSQHARVRAGSRAARWTLAVGMAILAAGFIDVILPTPFETAAEARKRTKRIKRTKPPLRAKKVPLPVRAPATPVTQASVPKIPDDGPAPNTQAKTVPNSVDRASKVAQEAIVVPPPHNPLVAVEERVATVLRKHCARCHQAGALEDRAAPDGGIANILALDKISRNPALVRPGEPDASPLYQQMIARQMPFDILRHRANGTPPDAAEIRTVRVWIKGLPGPHSNENCSARTPITHETLAENITRWLQAIGPERAADTRFISLANLYNTCASDAELAGFRQGVIQTLNSITWSKKPVAIEIIGESLILVSVRLSELGWTNEHWRELTRSSPGRLGTDLPASVREQTGTDVPLVNGDWFAHQAMQPALYARLLGLPPTLNDLARILGVSLDDNRDARAVRRSIALDSTVTGGPRVIERYATPRGPLWIAHDYAAKAASSILDFPMLPWAATVADEPGHAPPRLIASRAIFTLPNGLPAFMLFDENGRALSELIATPADTADDTSQNPDADTKAQNKPDPDKPPTPARFPHSASPPRITKIGLQCASCHAGGPQGYVDSLSDHLASDDYRGNPRARDVARQTTVSRAELQALLADDAFKVARAADALGPNAKARVDGHTPVTGLAARYNRDLDLTAAAAELLIPVADLQQRLSHLSGSSTPAAPLAVRLVLSRLSREQFEALRGFLHHNLAPARAPAALQPSWSGTTASDGKTQEPRPMPPAKTLQLWPDRISYARNNRIVLNVVSPRACHLTLVNVDQQGRSTVLFPNQFTRDNLVKPGKVTRIPAADALYFFRLQQPGTEQFIAICEDSQPVPAGITPNLTHMNFTALGDWEDFLDASLRAASQPRVPLNNGDDIDRRRSNRKADLPAAPRISPAQSRAAVTITIAP